jgi:uncharacterized protein (DUF2267 family)
MKYDEFVAEVQERANLRSRDEAQRAIRATFETLGERLTADEASDLAAQLPQEIAIYLLPPYTEGTAQDFSLDEFFDRVSQREGVPLPDATLHARIVTGLLTETVTMGEIEDIRAQLPEDIRQLFMVENEGELPEVPEVDTQGTGFGL